MLTTAHAALENERVLKESKGNLMVRKTESVCVMLTLESLREREGEREREEEEGIKTLFTQC